jgi:hypothetical protein
MRRKAAFILGALILGALATYGVFVSWGYTSVQLAIARSGGVFPSPEEGMRSLVEGGYEGLERIEIRYAGPNSPDGLQPHVWYVIADVWARSRADGSPVANRFRDHDNPGSFFLETQEGWVHVPEGAFPELVGLWMTLFGLAGEGSPVPSHPM